MKELSQFVLFVFGLACISIVVGFFYGETAIKNWSIGFITFVGLFCTISAVLGKIMELK